MDLSNYETVKQRKKRFYEAHPDGRIVVVCERADEKGALFGAYIFKNREDQEKSLPWSTGFAQELKGVGSFANKTSWTENCEESAVGRALDNAGYSGNNMCSREEMQGAARNEQTLSATNGTVKETNITQGGSAPFTFTFGKYKGQTIEEVGVEKARGYFDWLQAKANQDRKPLSKNAEALRDALGSYAPAYSQPDYPEDVPF